MTDTDTEDIPDIDALPEDPGPFLDLLIPEPDQIDDLVDSLLRYGAAQDYPEPEPELGRPKLQVKRLNDHRHSHYRPEYTDLRSRTKDADLDEDAVPGYQEFPPHLAINFGKPTQCLARPPNKPDSWPPPPIIPKSLNPPVFLKKSPKNSISPTPKQEFFEKRNQSNVVG